MTDQAAPPTNEQLDELETHAKNTPAGPWTVDDSRAELRGSHGNLLADLWDDRLGAYFAAMHDAVLPLVAEVRRLRAELRIGPPWTCQTCSKENTRDVCVICETDRPDPVEDAPAQQPAAACGKCKTPYDPADTRFDGHARHRETPYCRRCVDLCRDNEIADHRCVICAPTGV